MSEVTGKVVKEMAQLALLANKISEAQAKNLQLYPFVFFDDIKEVKIDYDLGHAVNEDKKELHHNSYVSYFLTLDESSNSEVELRSKYLERSVRTLFWNDVKIKVHFNDRLVYESEEKYG